MNFASQSSLTLPRIYPSLTVGFERSSIVSKVHPMKLTRINCWFIGKPGSNSINGDKAARKNRRGDDEQRT
jgi:hypothetical protein